METRLNPIVLDDGVDRSGMPTVSPLTEFQSVIRIHVLEAENLIAKDNFMGGMIKGKSDPYVKVRLGGQKFRSRVIKEDLNPRWSEIYEVSIHPSHLHILKLYPPRPLILSTPQRVGFDGEIQSYYFLGLYICTVSDLVTELLSGQ